MTHLLMQEHDILECEDFRYSECEAVHKATGIRTMLYQFRDHAEGECIRLEQSEFIRIIAESLADQNEEEVDEYHRALAVNLLANSTRTGRAAFLYGMMP